jgi:hypothetical protein
MLRSIAMNVAAVALIFTSSESFVSQGGSFAIDGPHPPNLEALIDSSPLIAEVSVRTIFPYNDNPRPGYTDFILHVEQVLKGTFPRDEIAVHQPGGGRAQSTQFAMMETGKHYILLLDINPPPQYPDRGIPRFIIKGGFLGLVSIDADKVFWSVGMGAQWKQKYDGQSVPALSAVIKGRAR